MDDTESGYAIVVQIAAWVFICTVGFAILCVICYLAGQCVLNLCEIHVNREYIFFTYLSSDFLILLLLLKIQMCSVLF